MRPRPRTGTAPDSRVIVRYLHIHCRCVTAIQYVSALATALEDTLRQRLWKTPSPRWKRVLHQNRWPLGQGPPFARIPSSRRCAASQLEVDVPHKLKLEKRWALPRPLSHVGYLIPAEKVAAPHIVCVVARSPHPPRLLHQWREYQGSMFCWPAPAPSLRPLKCLTSR